MVPALEINGKKIAEAVPSGVNYGNRVDQIIEETKVEDSQASNQSMKQKPDMNDQVQDPPQPIKKKPFIPPLLGAKNLGMSTLVQANGKTQEENDVAGLVAGNVKPAPPQAESAPVSVKKKPFIPPLLGAKNLGMSTLV